MPVAHGSTRVDHAAHPWVGTAAHAAASIDRGTFDAALLRHRLRRRGEASLLMRGRSMAPLFPEGSRVKLRPLTGGETLRGAIVAVERGQKVVVHRVVSVDGATIVTRGLNARSSDDPTSRGAVIGVVCEREGWPAKELHLRRAATAWTLSLRSFRALRRRL